MAWTRTFAICGALVAFPTLANAQVELTERLRAQGIYSFQSGQPPPRDIALQAMPELSLFANGKRSQVRLTYQLTGTVHSDYPADIANRLNLTSTFELSKRTTQILSAEVGHSSVTNALIAQSPASTPLGITPITVTHLAFARASEGTSWEASPVVRLRQVVDAGYSTTIDAPLTLESYLATAVLSADRLWKKDAVGIDLRGGYGRTLAEPLPPLRLVPMAISPHWQHDISPTLTSYLAGGAAVVWSPDPGTKPIVGPFAQGSLNYLLYDDTTFEVLGSVGPQANGITAQLFYTRQVLVRATAPLSRSNAVVGSTSAGYTYASILDARRDGNAAPDIQSFLADVGVGWSPIPTVELFARYQLLGQITDNRTVTAATGERTVLETPSVWRNVFLVGVQLSSRPDTVRVQTRFPQRVDRGDAPRAR